MRALTISQPFAWLIANGHKRVENRTWRAEYRGELLIHAGRGEQYRDDYEEMRTEWWPTLGIPSWRDVPRGAVVAVARLSAIVPLSEASIRDREWAEGPWCWELDDVRSLDRPIAAKGEQGLWTPAQDLVARVREELARAPMWEARS